MTHSFSQRGQRLTVVTAVIAALLWRLAAAPFFGVVPNVMLVAVLVMAFFVRDPLLFAWGIAGVLLSSVYLPFFQVEYLLLVALGMAGFLFARMFVFERKLALFIGIVGIAQGIWWIGIGYGTEILGIPFVSEFLYNAIVASALFFVVVWLEETFS